MAAQFESDILACLWQTNIGDPALGTGDISTSNIEAFENQAKLWCGLKLGKSTLSATEILALKLPTIWKTTALILKKFGNAEARLWETWEADAKSALLDYQTNPPDITDAASSSDRPRGDEGDRQDPFPREDTDAFVKAFKI